MYNTKLKISFLETLSLSTQLRVERSLGLDYVYLVQTVAISNETKKTLINVLSRFLCDGPTMGSPILETDLAISGHFRGRDELG